MAFAESRIRAETIAAEDILQDIGAISMVSSDSQVFTLYHGSPAHRRFELIDVRNGVKWVHIFAG